MNCGPASACRNCPAVAPQAPEFAYLIVHTESLKSEHSLYGPPYRASKYSSGEMTATERTVCRISLRGPLCAGEAFPLRFFSTRPFWGIPPPPRPLTLASSLRVGPRGGGGLLRKSFATYIYECTCATNMSAIARDLGIQPQVYMHRRGGAARSS